jgi:hypothetical protein
MNLISIFDQFADSELDGSKSQRKFGERGNVMTISYQPRGSYYVYFRFPKIYKYMRVAPFFGQRIVFGLFNEQHDKAFSISKHSRTNAMQVNSKVLVEYLLKALGYELDDRPVTAKIPFTVESDDCITIKCIKQ